ncbi:MAG: peptidylprolyl isomerase [Planctomycetaceae bacterium]|nr:peptidylprolyl isomerase [Planctomycetaceae bacterium]
MPRFSSSRFGEAIIMGEGNHLPAAKPPTAIYRIGYIFGGTAVVLIAALVLMQTLKAQPGQAAPETAGTAKLSNRPQKQDLAKVGKDTIPYDMVADECVTRYGREVLDDLINRMIIQQACEARGIVVSEEEVSAEVQRISKRFNLEPQAWYQMLEAERNITPLQYRQSVIWPMIALKKLAGEQVDLTEEEMNKAFVRNYGPRVKARLILFDRIGAAQKCWEKAAQDPEGFEKLAQEFSIDPSSRSLGGTIPPIPRYSGNDALETAAFKLQAGEISGIIELQSGRWAILKCEGRTEPVTTNIDDVRDSLYEELHEAKTQESVAKVFEAIKKNAQVDNYLTGTTTGPNRPFTSPAPGGAIQQINGQAPSNAQKAAAGTRSVPATANGARTAPR